MDWYIQWVGNNRLVSAAIQFGILGTLGEVVSLIIRKKKISALGNVGQILGKMLAWSLLGVIIKYGFIGMKAFVDGLIAQGLLPNWAHGTIGWAFMVSVMSNILFGPQMMFFHRLEENLIMWRWDTSGLKNAWMTLLWFWIPAHTVTFSLPTHYQIGLAALWSVALGVIMGLSAPRK